MSGLLIKLGTMQGGDRGGFRRRARVRRDAAARDVRGVGAALGARRLVRVQPAARALRPGAHQPDRHVCTYTHYLSLFIAYSR